MKKLLTVLLVILVLATLLVAALPVSARHQGGGYNGWPGAPCGTVGGGPPGWSQVSWGEGGSGSPGIGPGAP